MIGSVMALSSNKAISANEEIKNFIKRASVTELREYVELLKSRGGYDNLIKIILYILAKGADSDERIS